MFGRTPNIIFSGTCNPVCIYVSFHYFWYTSNVFSDFTKNWCSTVTATIDWPSNLLRIAEEHTQKQSIPPVRMKPLYILLHSSQSSSTIIANYPVSKPSSRKCYLHFPSVSYLQWNDACTRKKPKLWSAFFVSLLHRLMDDKNILW